MEGSLEKKIYIQSAVTDNSSPRIEGNDDGSQKRNMKGKRRGIHIFSCGARGIVARTGRGRDDYSFIR